MINRSNKLSYMSAALLMACIATAAIAQQKIRKPAHIYLDLNETNLDKPSTIAKDMLSERLAAAGFKMTINRREADFIVEGSINSQPAPVTDDVKREGGVNAEATATVRLLSGSEVIAAIVERSAPGDWGTQAERVGEDRLIEVAGHMADDFFSGNVVMEVSGFNKGSENVSSFEVSASSKPSLSRVKTARKPVSPNRGLSLIEVIWLVQNRAPEDHIISALRKYGIRFQPHDAVFNQLRSFGASEDVISAVKTSNVV